MKKFKNFISLFTIFMIALSIFPKEFITFAQSNNNITVENNIIDGKIIVALNAKYKDGKLINVYDPMTGKISEQPIVGIGKISLDGNPVYCLEPEMGVNINNLAGYNRVNFENSGLNLNSNQEERIALYSYYGNIENMISNDNNWYIATQILIWEELGYYDFSDLYIVDDIYATPYESSKKIDNMKIILKNKVNTYFEDKKYTPIFFYNNKEIYNNTIDVKKSDLINGIDVIEKNNKINIYQEVISSNNIDVKIQDNKIHIIAKSTNINNNEEINLNLINQKYISERYVEVLNNSQKIGVLNLNKNNQKSEVLKLNIIDDLPKEVLFSKHDIAGNELAGATIELSNKADGKVIDTWVSDGQGAHTF
ncbi:TPA: hypothetical protein I9Z77_003112, partial [Clostridium perfringens]|nr:hypothetical protein [Clostridium perfringens]